MTVTTTVSYPESTIGTKDYIPSSLTGDSRGTMLTPATAIGSKRITTGTFGTPDGIRTTPKGRLLANDLISKPQSGDILSKNGLIGPHREQFQKSCNYNYRNLQQLQEVNRNQNGRVSDTNVAIDIGYGPGAIIPVQDRLDFQHSSNHHQNHHHPMCNNINNQNGSSILSSQHKNDNYNHHRPHHDTPHPVVRSYEDVETQHSHHNHQQQQCDSRYHTKQIQLQRHSQRSGQTRDLSNNCVRDATSQYIVEDPSIRERSDLENKSNNCSLGDYVELQTHMSEVEKGYKTGGINLHCDQRSQHHCGSQDHHRHCNKLSNNNYPPITQPSRPVRRKLQLSSRFDITWSQYRSGLVLYPVIDVEETDSDSDDKSNDTTLSSSSAGVNDSNGIVSHNDRLSSSDSAVLSSYYSVEQINRVKENSSHNCNSASERADKNGYCRQLSAPLPLNGVVMRQHPGRSGLCDNKIVPLSQRRSCISLVNNTRNVCVSEHSPNQSPRTGLVLIPNGNHSTFSTGTLPSSFSRSVSNCHNNFNNNRLTKCKSEGNLAFAGLLGGNSAYDTGNGTPVSQRDRLFSEDDDEENDYGFLSWNFTCNFSPAMQKAPKSPSATHRILPKRWRSKSKALPTLGSSSLWSQEGACTWCSVSGRRVTLRGASLLELSDAERLALRKIALTKLQGLNLGCAISIPKENNQMKGKKRVLRIMKRKSHSANLSTLLDDIKNKEKEKEVQPIGLVFGIPLAKCVSNDVEMRKKKRCTQLREQKEHRHSVTSSGQQTGQHRKSSSSSTGSGDNVAHNRNGSNYLSSSPASATEKTTASSDSLSESESSRNTSSSLLDALSLSTSSGYGTSPQAHLQQLNLKTPQVPQVVNICFKHLETYGLQTLGIFRIGASKKRIKQIRDEFDSGKDVKLNEGHNPHDIAALLKEYFRDLPEPILTRDLYLAFVATRRMSDANTQDMALKLLITLIPSANRDTLWALLKFLHKVALHSIDSLDVMGHLVPGNKMDSHNLATLFGPNILHKAKMPNDKGFLVEDTDRLEERKDVIEVLKDLIDNLHEIFQIPPDLHDEVIRLIMETEPDTADTILKELSSEFGIEPDPDTSTSSVFDDSDTASIPRSPSSDVAFNISTQPTVIEHEPVRRVRGRDCYVTKVDDTNDNRPSRKALHDILRQVKSAGPSVYNKKQEIPSNVSESRHSPRKGESDTSPYSACETSDSSPPIRSSRMPGAPRLCVTHEKSNPDPSSSDAGSRDWDVASAKPKTSDYYTNLGATNRLGIPTMDHRHRSSSSSSGGGGGSHQNSPSPSPVSDSHLYTPPSGASGANSPRTSPARYAKTASDNPIATSSQQRPLSSHRPLGIRTSAPAPSSSNQHPSSRYSSEKGLRDYDRERRKPMTNRILYGYGNQDDHEQETLV